MIRFRKLDAFAAVNVALFSLLGAARYHARFIAYRGSEHIEEFFLYAIVLLVVVLLVWWHFRRYDFGSALLIALQVGILMHFAGAFVQIDGGRLYDAHLLGVRYDKYVHLVNAFNTTMVAARLFEIKGLQFDTFNRCVLVLGVLGLGGLVELVEYLVLLTVPGAGVGGYDNNMQDLAANLVGALSYQAVQPFWVVLRGIPRGFSPHPEQARHSEQ